MEEQNQEAVQNTNTSSQTPFYAKFLQNKVLLSCVVVIVVLVLLGGTYFVLSNHKTSSNQPKQITSKTHQPSATPSLSVSPTEQTSNDQSSQSSNNPTTAVKPTAVITKIQPTATPVPQSTNTPVPTYSISGYVFNDENGNGSYDSGEQGYAGQTVWILSIAKSTTTDSSGHYSFGGLTPATYNVTVNNPDTSKTGEGDNPRFVTITNSDGSADFEFK